MLTEAEFWAVVEAEIARHGTAQRASLAHGLSRDRLAVSKHRQVVTAKLAEAFGYRRVVFFESLDPSRPLEGIHEPILP